MSITAFSQAAQPVAVKTANLVLGNSGYSFHRIDAAGNIRTQAANLFHEFIDAFCVERRFRRSDPFQTKTFFFHTELRKQPAEQKRSAESFDIACQVMTIARVTSPYENSIGPRSESLDYVARINHSGAKKPDYSDIGSLDKPGYPGGVRSNVRTPVAQKRNYLRFKILHARIPSI
jgi:hypothetical protein